MNQPFSFDKTSIAIPTPYTPPALQYRQMVTGYQMTTYPNTTGVPVTGGMIHNQVATGQSEPWLDPSLMASWAASITNTVNAQTQVLQSTVEFVNLVRFILASEPEVIEKYKQYKRTVRRLDDANGDSDKAYPQDSAQ